MSYQVALNKKYAVYPEYKPSGVEWVGEMPNQWLMVRTKFLFTRQQRSVRPEDDIVTAFRDGQVTLRKNRRTEGFTNALQEIGYQGIRKGDLIVHAMDAFAGAIGVSDSDGKSSPVYSVLTSKNVEETHTPYYGRLLRHMALSGFINSLAKGIRERSTEFRYSEVAELELPVPSIEEQRTIAAFLDYETARIDLLIAKQQRLIELLKEKRQAVISHAVTKGLNPNAPMKDSGVEWLGQVPEHWKCSRVGWLCEVGNGMTPNRNNTEYWNEGHIPWLNSSKVNDGEVYFAEQFVTETAFAECSLPWVKSNSVIMAITGEGKTRGTTAITRIDTTINQHVSYMMPISERIVPDFLCMWLQSQYGRIRFESEGWGSTKAAITCSDIKAYPIPLPSVPEQVDIVERVKASNTKFDNLMLYASKQVDLLQERRTALISAAVTGKIDLRGWNHPEAKQ